MTSLLALSHADNTLFGTEGYEDRRWTAVIQAIRELQLAPAPGPVDLSPYALTDDLGTMAYQNASNVDIDGGVIDGVEHLNLGSAVDGSTYFSVDEKGGVGGILLSASDSVYEGGLEIHSDYGVEITSGFYGASMSITADGGPFGLGDVKIDAHLDANGSIDVYGYAVFRDDVEINGDVAVDGTIDVWDIEAEDIYASSGLIVEDTAYFEAGGAIPTKIGFFDAAHVASAASKQTVTGARGGNTALESLLDALAAYGLITDSTSF